MISVKKDFTNAPASLSHSNCLAKVEASIKNKSYQKSDWYKKEDTKVALKEIYNNKCAYCEGFSAAQAPFPVEHYRPKGKVTVFINNKIIDVSNHNGYYWLAYEWSNLLWSCFWCNQHKASQFTLEDETQRVFQPTLNIGGDLIEKDCLIDADVLLAEKPLLLNPEIDKAEDHFYFLPNGEIKSITKRGKETIRICKLDREDLCLARRKLADNFFKNIRTEVTDFLDFGSPVDYPNFKRNIKNILTRIYKRAEPENDYSRFGYFMFVQFENFFVKKPSFDTETQKVLLEIYEEFKNNVFT